MNFLKLILVSMTTMTLTLMRPLDASTRDVDVSRLNPRVLYIDLVAPDNAHGVTLVQEKKETSQQIELGGHNGGDSDQGICPR